MKREEDAKRDFEKAKRKFEEKKRREREARKEAEARKESDEKKKAGNKTKKDSVIIIKDSEAEDSNKSRNKMTDLPEKEDADEGQKPTDPLALLWINLNFDL